MRGPRNRYRPRKSRSPIKAPVFGSEYAALVHARVHNPRLAMQGKKTFDRCVVISPVGTRDIDLFRDYKPKRSDKMPAPYCVISMRQWPETVFEYSYDTLEECEAMVDVDERLKKGRVRDFIIVGADDKKLLAKLQEPELRHLHGKISRAVLSEEISYNELLNKVSTALRDRQTDKAPANVLELYRRKQRAETQAHIETVAPVVKSVKSTAKEIKTMSAEATEVKKAVKKTVGKTPTKATKKAAGKAPTKAAAKSAKGGSQKSKGKAAAAKGATNKAAGATKDPLGREGTCFRFMAERIMKGQGNSVISEAAAKAFPDSASTEAKHVAWARWKLGQNGVKVPDAK